MKRIVKWYNTAIITAILGGIAAAVLYSLLKVRAFTVVPILVCGLPVLLYSLFCDKDEQPEPGAMYRRCLIAIPAVLVADLLILVAYATRTDVLGQLAFMRRGDSACILIATMLLMSVAWVPVMASRRTFWVLKVIYHNAITGLGLVLCYCLFIPVSGSGAVLTIGNIWFTLPALIALGAAVAVFALTWWLHCRRYREKCCAAA